MISKFFKAFFITICLSACLMASSYAAADYDYIDFTNGEMGPISATIKTSTGGFGSVLSENGNDYFNIGVKCVSTTQAESDTYLQYSKYRNFSNNAELSFSMRMVKSVGGSISVSLRHNGTNANGYGTITFLSANPQTGKVTYLSGYGKSTSEILECGKWYDFKIKFDLPNNKISVYRGTELKAETNKARTYNEKTQLFNFEESLPRFYTSVSKSSVSNIVSVDFDNILFRENTSVDKDYFITNKKLYGIYDSGEREISTLRKGSFEARADVENMNATESKNCRLMVGLYDENGKMLNMLRSEQHSLMPNEKKTVVCPFEVEKVNGGEYIKIFIIDDFSGITPIALYDQYDESLLNPPAEEILEDVLKKNPNNRHPRLMLTPEKLDFLKTACFEQEPYMTWYNKIRLDAEKLLEKGFAVYEDLDELRLKGIYTSASNISTLAFVYAIENAAGNPADRYAKRIVDEMINVSVENPEWPDWNPKHFLDTSEIMVAYGFAYDWCYDYFNRPENAGEKEMMMNTLEKYGLDASKKSYDGIANRGWTNATSNWNMVCNAGVALSALAVCDEEGMGELCAELLQDGFVSVRKSFSSFEPEGAWFEGVGYWHYTVDLMSIYFDCMKTAAGTDYDYMSLPGVPETGFYPIAMTGRTGSFNLNDSGSSMVSVPEFWFLAKQFNEPTFAKYRYYQIFNQKLSTSYKDIIWYDESMLGDKESIPELLNGMKTDKKYGGIEVATFRDGYFESGKYYLGLHGGENGLNHGHIDAGSFVYDAKTEGGKETRWAIDIGSEAYNLHCVFGSDPDPAKSRWSYYRLRGEGHNTIIINPGILKDQPTDTVAVIDDYKTSDKYGYATVDMQPIYGEYTSEAHRGAYLNKENGGLLIRDELVFNEDYADLENNLYWFMHTKAEVEVAEDGKSAILTLNDQRLWVGILDGEQTIAVMNAVPLETSPNPNEWPENMDNDGSSTNPKKQNANVGIRKLVINDTKAGGEWNMTVYMVLLEEGEDAPSTLPENLTIASWKE